MTTFDYSKMETLADTLLTKFGADMTLTSFSEDTIYDPHEGKTMLAETTSTVTGVILPTSSAKVKGSPGAISDFDNSSVGTDLVDSKRRFGLIKAKNATEPKIADRLVDSSGNEFRITGVTPVEPAGTKIIYRLGLETA